MTRRIMLYGSVVAIIIAFAFFMGIGWDRQSGKAKEVGNALENLFQTIEHENWEGAAASLDEVEKAWTAVYARLDFIQERLPLFQFETDLARMKGAIIVRDRAGAMQLVMEMRSLWAAF